MYLAGPDLSSETSRHLDEEVKNDPSPVGKNQSPHNTVLDLNYQGSHGTSMVGSVVPGG